MGQTLTEPVTTKTTESTFNSHYKVGSSCMQGWRTNMEDAHTHILSLPKAKEVAFFGVFDGHGVVDRKGGAMFSNKRKVEEAIKEGFLELDEQMVGDSQLVREEVAGTTAVTILIKDSVIYCGNAGDSRAIASVSGKAIELSIDHKPSNEAESARIYAAGGYVEGDRVNGNLALSRALGDFGYKQVSDKSAKQQIVTAEPEIKKLEITQDVEFLVLACDGIWDVMSSQEVVDFCRKRLAEEKEPEQVCEELLDHCLAPANDSEGVGGDNMTVIIVCLLQNQSTQKYVKRLSTPPRLSTSPAKQE
uniref:protein-serine/threonine phosphatase n=1 Tax=Ditylenchus dipsaci TaxID=166011 RepID=A0A915CX64_9BILA